MKHMYFKLGSSPAPLSMLADESIRTSARYTVGCATTDWLLPRVLEFLGLTASTSILETHLSRGTRQEERCEYVHIGS